MKKIFVFILLSVCAWMILGAVGNSSADTTDLLTANTWKFKSAFCQDPSTVQYLNPIYTGSTYKFDRNGTYSGRFFELPISGTWEISAETLVLNKGSRKEESYTFSLPSQDKLVLEIFEKGNKALLEFENEKKIPEKIMSI